MKEIVYLIAFYLTTQVQPTWQVVKLIVSLNLILKLVV